MARRILLACDNHDDINWGCRATSLALSQVIDAGAANGCSPRITGRITRGQVTQSLGFAPSRLTNPLPDRARVLVLGRLLPSAFKRRRSENEPWPRLTNYASKATRGRVGGDFVDLDPTTTARTILRNRSIHPYYDALCDAVERADRIVVNGEGSLILRDPPRRDMLFQFGVLALARLLGRPSYYVNAMVSDCPVSGRSASTSRIALQALNMCESVATRDPISYEVLGDIAPGVDRHLVPDALFSWAPRFVEPGDLLPKQADAAISFPEDPDLFGRFDFDQPYLAVSGGSLASWDQARAVETYVALVSALHGLGLPIVLVQTCRGDRFLHQVGASTDTPVLPVRTPILQGGAVLARARAFVSARYHPSILASLGGAPLVMMQGNSFKNEGLRRWIDRGEATVYPAYPDDEQITAIVRATADAVDAGDDHRESIRARACHLGEQTAALRDIVGSA